MGYTHYWNYNKSDNDPKQFAKAGAQDLVDMMS
jgi:hypothetical protein